MSNDLSQALNSLFDVLHLNSLFDVLHLNHENVDEVIDDTIEGMTLMAEVTSYPEEALAAVKQRAEAIREAVKNNPLPELPPPCKQPVH